MNLADYLSVEQIVPKLSAPDRWATIDQLVDVLVRARKLRPEDREVVRKAVKDRETTKSTGIGYGIALPHASVPAVEEVVVAFARLHPAVDFQALDSQPVTMCLLLLTPQGQFQQHLHALSTIARVLSDKARRQSIESAATADEILALFRAAT
jgi:mannitol/fructose-specific phosphotransferase system IIA component (Ntr-type)